MGMYDVGSEPSHDRADPPPRTPRETDRRDRPVVRDPQRSPDHANPGLGRGVGTRRKHDDHVVACDEVLRELANVDLNTTGGIP